MTRLVAVALLALLSLTACGGGGDDQEGGRENAPESETDNVRSCSDVWVAGEILPEDYEGCDEGDGAISAPVISECADGSKWTSYNDAFYAKLGGEITEVQGEMSDDPAYSAFYDECLG